MSIHASPVEQTLLQTLPNYTALDLTEKGDLAKFFLGEQKYTLQISRAPKLTFVK